MRMGLTDGQVTIHFLCVLSKFWFMDLGEFLSPHWRDASRSDEDILDEEYSFRTLPISTVFTTGHGPRSRSRPSDSATKLTVSCSTAQHRTAAICTRIALTGKAQAPCRQAPSNLSISLFIGSKVSKPCDEMFRKVVMPRGICCLANSTVTDKQSKPWELTFDTTAWPIR